MVTDLYKSGLADRDCIRVVSSQDVGCFILPPISRQYFEKHTFADWKKIWDQQCKDNEDLHLTAPQLKNILIARVMMPWREEIVEAAMTKPISDVLSLIEQRCRSYKATRKVAILSPKRTTESFEEYMLRLKKLSEEAGTPYTDVALCQVLYQYAPLHLRSLFLEALQKEHPGELAALIDNEVASVVTQSDRSHNQHQGTLTSPVKRCSFPKLHSQSYTVHLSPSFKDDRHAPDSIPFVLQDILSTKK